jgi:hypothetical protein
MSDQAEDSRNALLDGEGRLAEDLHCLRCAYNLRGLHPQALCPECGGLISLSIQGDALRYGDPVWVRRLASGASWLFFGLLAVTLVNLTYWLGYYILGASSFLIRHSPFVYPPLRMACDLAFGIGCWKLTTADPGKSRGVKLLNARSLARWTLLVSLVSRPIWSLLGHPGILVHVLHALFVLAVGGVGTIALLVHAGRTARRIPSPRLARSTWVVLVGVIMVWALDVLPLLLYVVVSPQGAARGQFLSGYALVQSCPQIAALVLAVLALRLAGRFRSALSEASEQSAVRWATFRTA